MEAESERKVEERSLHAPADSTSGLQGIGTDKEGWNDSVPQNSSFRGLPRVFLAEGLEDRFHTFCQVQRWFREQIQLAIGPLGFVAQALPS